MAEEAFHLQNATTLNWTIGGTSYPVAGISDATITLSQGIVELYTGDSTTREDKYAEEKTFEADITVRKWDHELIGTEILDGESINDSSEIPDTTLEGTFESAQSDREVTIELVGGSTEEWPIFDLSLGDYGEWQLSMTFDDIETFEVTTPE